MVRALLVPDQGFSILVESTQPVAATRQMTWGSPVYGSTLESGIPSTSPTWYFAEGATNIFSLYYMVENPNAMPANVVLTHLLEGGAAPVTQTAVVPPFTRRTFDINDVPGLASAALSTIVASDAADRRRARDVPEHHESTLGRRRSRPRSDRAEHVMVVCRRRDRVLPHLSLSGKSQ